MLVQNYHYTSPTGVDADSACADGGGDGGVDAGFDCFHGGFYLSSISLM